MTATDVSVAPTTHGRGQRRPVVPMAQRVAPTTHGRGGVRPSLVRLVRVELRKTTDTRAGLWLLVLIGVIAAAFVAIQLVVAEPQTMTFENFLRTAVLPVGLLLPVLGILAVTSEWSQRTSMTTFTLVPQRQRVVVAKLIAAVLLSLFAVVACLGAAALGNLIAPVVGDAPGGWAVDYPTLGYAVVFQVVNVLVGLGLGMLLLNSPLAIVLYFLLPTLLTILTTMVTALQRPLEWLNLDATVGRLLDEAMTGEAWAQLATSFGTVGSPAARARGTAHPPE